jgi:ArsR family transcriptional regulator, virulence genes transcriptional regulator
MNLSDMRATAPKVCELLRQLANENRLMLLCQLVTQERSVGDLAQCLQMRQAGVSQHLARLRSAGLVCTRREAQTIYYSIADPDVAKLLRFLYETYCSDDASSGVTSTC